MEASTDTRLEFRIQPQPNLVTCGPTCLQAVYDYYNDPITLDETIAGVEMLDEGGTLAVLLATHALRRGYRARIYTYNLSVFDPSWFSRPGINVAEKLRAQAEVKQENPKLQAATRGYLEFFRLGGELRFQDLTPRLIRKKLAQHTPIITGLSATYLYHEPREMPDCTFDDLRGEPSGHFVVLSGYYREAREVLVADPLTPNAHGHAQYYTVPIERVIGSIFLGILTYDSNMLIIEPADRKKGPPANGDLLRR